VRGVPYSSAIVLWGEPGGELTLEGPVLAKGGCDSRRIDGLDARQHCIIIVGFDESVQATGAAIVTLTVSGNRCITGLEHALRG
jgi:hypothetical protein